MEERIKRDHSNAKWKVAIIAMIAIIILLLGFSCSARYTTDIPDEPIPLAQGEDYQKMLDDEVAESMMNVNYMPYVGMQSDGIHSSTFMVNNSPNNHDKLKFYIYDSNGNEIYESAEIPQGYQINQITLKEPLSKGEHDCTIKLQYNSTGNIASTFPLKITVH